MSGPQIGLRGRLEGVGEPGRGVAGWHRVPMYGRR